MTIKLVHIKKYYLLIVAWLLTLMVIFPLLTFVMIKTWENHKNTLARQIDVLSDGFYDDINAYLMPLNSRFPHPEMCDQATIRAMQQADFQAKSLAIFTVINDNKIVCASEGGLLATPVPLLKPNWINSSGVKVTLEQPIPLFDGKVTGQTVQAGKFLAFLNYQHKQSQPHFPWLTFINYGLTLGKEAYSYGPGGFSAAGYTPFTSGQRQWYEDGHWLFSECRENRECKIIAIDILGYFKEESSTAMFVILFLITIMTLTTIGSLRLHNWLYSLPRQVSRGLNNHQLELNYQPVISYGSGKIDGCEVLCRWHTLDGTKIQPEEFIKVVENCGLTRQLTELVVTKCISDLQAADLLGKCRVAINAFPDDIASGHILRVFCRQLSLKNFGFFTIELTEQKISDLPALCEGVRHLRTVGFRVAIDDFGTGFSNLEGLRELSVDTLKIDKCFVWGADSPSLKRSLIEHIVNIAKSLQLKIVAEGVETQEQLAYLRRLNVDYSQGYLHSRPIKLKEFAALLHQANNKTVLTVEPVMQS